MRLVEDRKSNARILEGERRKCHVFESSDGNRKSGRRSGTQASALGPAGCRFSIATDEVFTDKQGQKQERVDWHHIVAFGKLAEICNQYLKKSRQVFVERRLRTREFEAKNNGGKRERTEIVTSRVQFLGAPPTERADATAVEDPHPLAEDVPF